MARQKGDAFVPTEYETCYVGGPLGGIKVPRGVWSRNSISTFDGAGKRSTKWVNDRFLPHPLPDRTPTFTHREKRGRTNLVFTKVRGHYELEYDDKYHWYQDEIVEIVAAVQNEDGTYSRKDGT